MRKTALVLTSLAVMAVTPALAQQEPEAIANLSPQGREAFRLYSQFAEPKAFAIASDGSYGFFGGRGDLDQAMDEAIRRCEGVAGAGNCKIVSANDEPVIAAAPDVARALHQLNTTAGSNVRDEAIRDFRRAPTPKALATSGDGAWGWVAGATSVEQASAEALRHCNEWGQNCEITETQ